MNSDNSSTNTTTKSVTSTLDEAESVFYPVNLDSIANSPRVNGDSPDDPLGIGDCGIGCIDLKTAPSSLIMNIAGTGFYSNFDSDSKCSSSTSSVDISAYMSECSISEMVKTPIYSFSSLSERVNISVLENGRRASNNSPTQISIDRSSPSNTSLRALDDGVIGCKDEKLPTLSHRQSLLANGHDSKFPLNDSNIIEEDGELLMDKSIYSTINKSSSSPTPIPTELLIEMENKSTRQKYLSVQNEGQSSVKSLSFANLSSVSLTSSIESQVSSMTDESVDYSRLDRYGFIVYPGISRSPLSEDRLDSAVVVGGAADEQNIISSTAAKIEARRAIKWIEMLRLLEGPDVATVGRDCDGKESPLPAIPVCDWPKAHGKFERRLVKGIPDCLRGKVWALFMACPYASSGSSANQSYRELYLKISGFERQIDLDIERTLRDHVLFKARFSSAQVSLFKILVAYSNLDPEVGYCQGMSTIAAFILMYFDEEAAFNFLKHLFRRDGLRLLFAAGFPLLFESFYVQEILMKRYLKKLYNRLDSFGIGTSVYATKWYLTLYLGCLPFSLATRVWDLFLFWGADMLVCVAVALLQVHRKRLLRLDYEPCMQALSRLPEAPVEEDYLMKSIWGMWKTIHADLGPAVFSDLRRQYAQSL